MSFTDKIQRVFGSGQCVPPPFPPKKTQTNKKKNPTKNQTGRK